MRSPPAPPSPVELSRRHNEAVHVALLAMGSRGDVGPLVALGRGLAGAGHRVTVVVPADLTPWVERRGLRAAAFPVDLRTAAGEQAALAWQAGASRGLRREARVLTTVMETLAEPIADGVLAAVERADLVVSGALTFDAAATACRHRGLPHVLALLAPLAPARDGAATAYAALPGRRSALNQATSLLVASAAHRVLAAPGAVVRERLGMRRGSLREHLRTAYGTPALLACSPTLVPPDPSWGRQLRITGPWRGPAPAGWEPPSPLAGFLADGPPPVYAGFGSMAARDPAGILHALLEAAERTGRRLLLGAGWAGLPAGSLPPWAHAVEDAPHEWLLPRTAAVVHHGGAGTTHTAARAGVPQVVVPHLGDQPYWARRVHQLGVAAEPLPRDRLSAVALAARLRTAGRPEVAARARRLGQRMRQEPDGVARAVGLLRRWTG